MRQDSLNVPVRSYADALRRNQVEHFVTLPEHVQMALDTCTASVPAALRAGRSMRGWSGFLFTRLGYEDGRPTRRLRTEQAQP